ncbi:hypothetical protein predicted by Glimmer/Critica [Lactiplantibacillus plantarum]|nr:hypothetical protein predicted by Glimmer/Critica [Lactiplantibacillus plantarum]
MKTFFLSSLVEPYSTATDLNHKIELASHWRT